ncbi:Repeat domain-containing protein, partial [Clostridium cavendishii DSM 21758]
MKIKKLKSLFFTVGVVFISSVFLTNPVEAKAYYAGGDNNVTLHSWNVNNFNGTSQNLWARTTSSYLPKNIEGRTVAGDFNGDGKDEIAAFYDYSNAHTAIHLFMPDGSGNMTSKTAWDAPSFAASAIQYKVVAGDFDGDGKDEIATFYDYGNLKTALFLFKLDSNGQFSGSEVWQSPTFSGSCIVGVTAGDFNGDGKDEISLIYDYGNNHTGMFEFKQASSNKFTGRLAWESNSCDGSRVKNKVVSGDYDGNKKAEIVMFYDYGNAKTSAWTLINNNDTYSTKESWVAPSFDANAITGRVA